MSNNAELLLAAHLRAALALLEAVDALILYARNDD